MAAAGVAVMILALIGLRGELPTWRSGGAVSHTAVMVGFDPPGSLCSVDFDLIELRGDSLVNGSRMGGKGRPYGAMLAQQLGGEVEVLLRGHGGATAADGETMWRHLEADGDIVLLAYGTNDAASRGWLTGRRPVPLQQFRESLLRHIRQVRASGAQVGLIAPPPVSAPAAMERLEPYRLEVHKIGRKAGLTVFDPAEAFAGCRQSEPLLTVDGLHLNAAGHACLGRWLARALCG